MEMARALGASQSTISRLVRYIETLAADQLALIQREHEPDALRESIRISGKLRALRDEFYGAYHAGESGRLAELQRTIDANRSELRAALQQ
jgi:hypothetical protein